MDGAGFNRRLRPSGRTTNDDQAINVARNDDDLIPHRTRLSELLVEIQREFEGIRQENAVLRHRLEQLQEQVGNRQFFVSESDIQQESIPVIPSFTLASSASSSRGIMSRGHISSRLKATSSRIVSTFKQGLNITPVLEFRAHRDGIWEVSSARIVGSRPLVATASADHTARVFDANNGICLTHYMGHTGSVNSIKFHPRQNDMMLTASGDRTVHVWRTSVPAMDVSLPRGGSSDDEVDHSEREDDHDSGHLRGGDRSLRDSSSIFPQFAVVRTPMLELTGHTDAVMCADWVRGNNHIITASWDNTANLYDCATGELISQLNGHEKGLTHVGVHPTDPMCVTCSKDTTFRLWDFRESILCAYVFQGHTKTVTSCSFTSNGEHLVSGGDDHTVRIWDTKNMRYPLTTIRFDSAVNRLALSLNDVIAVPQDNRRLSLYDLNGSRICRSGRRNRLGHTKMISSCCWLEPYFSMSGVSGGPTSTPNASTEAAGATQCADLFSSSFDGSVYGWRTDPFVLGLSRDENTTPR